MTEVRGKERREHVEPILLAMVSLAKVTMGKREVKVREEKISLLLER